MTPSSLTGCVCAHSMTTSRWSAAGSGPVIRGSGRRGAYAGRLPSCGGAAMTVVEAVEAELEKFGVTASALGAMALSLARELDVPGNSATSKSMCAKALVDVLREIRALAPPPELEDEIERARQRRSTRLARASAPGSPSPS